MHEFRNERWDAHLKTVNGVTRSGVRIPLPPPETSSAVPKPFARTRPLAQGGALSRQPAFRAAAREVRILRFEQFKAFLLRLTAFEFLSFSSETPILSMSR